MSTLYLQIPRYLKPWPTSLDGLIQGRKKGLIDHKVYEKILKNHHLSLRRAGKIPKAAPSMYVLVVENDKDGKPLCAKSLIVVLGNFEDRLYQKSQRYAPVLTYSSLRLLTAKEVGDKWILQQGDFKNAFCNVTLPDDEVTVILPPIGDPAFQEGEYWLLKETLYGLRLSPIIGTIRSKRFCSIWASRPLHMIRYSFLV